MWVGGAPGRPLAGRDAWVGSGGRTRWGSGQRRKPRAPETLAVPTPGTLWTRRSCSYPRLITRRFRTRKGLRCPSRGRCSFAEVRKPRVCTVRYIGRASDPHPALLWWEGGWKGPRRRRSRDPRFGRRRSRAPPSSHSPVASGMSSAPAVVAPVPPARASGRGAKVSKSWSPR